MLLACISFIIFLCTVALSCMYVVHCMLVPSMEVGAWMSSASDMVNFMYNNLNVKTPTLLPSCAFHNVVKEETQASTALCLHV